MEFAIIVFFGSILFGFGLLFFAIRFWQRKRLKRNQNLERFSQGFGETDNLLNETEDNNSDFDDFNDYSNSELPTTSSEDLIGATSEISADLNNLNNNEIADSSWNYNSVETSSSSSEAGWSGCSSSSSDSSSSCSSGSSGSSSNND